MVFANSQFDKPDLLNCKIRVVDVPIMWRKNVKCEKHRNRGSAAAKHFHCFRFQKSSLFQILLIEYEIFV